MYPLTTFLSILERIYATSYSPCTPYAFQYPSLTTLLVRRYQSAQVYLALDGDDGSWKITDEQAAAYAFRLVVEIPMLTERMYLLITENERPAAEVVDLPALQRQIHELILQAYQRKFSSAS